MKKLDIQNAGRATHQALRDLNEILVLNVVRERQPVSRSDIAVSTGLEGSTVSKIVSRLLGNEFVYEEGIAAASPNGGRKKRFLHLNPNKACAVGVEVVVLVDDATTDRILGRAVAGCREDKQQCECDEFTHRRTCARRSRREAPEVFGVHAPQILAQLFRTQATHLRIGLATAFGDEVLR